MSSLLTARGELLTIDVRKSDVHAPVMLVGELDLSTARSFEALLAELDQQEVSHVALNLSELVFMDCNGLAVLIAEHKRTESLGGELIIFSPCHQVRRLFEVTGLDDYLNVRPHNA
jgi:stage II sporulation protein AA (anti-sigma F factor antagonist)